MKNHLFDFLDDVEGLPVGSTTANIEKEKKRQGYSETDTERDKRFLSEGADICYKCGIPQIGIHYHE